MKGTLHEDQGTFFIISRSVLLRMRNVSEEMVEKRETHILCYFFFLSSENRVVYEIMWKNIAEVTRQYNMAHAHCILDT